MVLFPQKRKSIGKIRGPNPKMKPTMQSKSVSHDSPVGHPGPLPGERVRGDPHPLFEVFLRFQLLALSSRP